MSDTGSVREKTNPWSKYLTRGVSDTGSVREKTNPWSEYLTRGVSDTGSVREKTNPWSEYLTRGVSDTGSVEKRRIHEVRTWHGECPTREVSERRRIYEVSIWHNECPPQTRKDESMKWVLDTGNVRHWQGVTSTEMRLSDTCVESPTREMFEPKNPPFEVTDTWSIPHAEFPDDTGSVGKTKTTTNNNKNR